MADEKPISDTLPEPIKIALYKGAKPIVFYTVSQLNTWAQRELEFWSEYPLKSQSPQPVNQVASLQIEGIKTILNSCAYILNYIRNEHNWSDQNVMQQLSQCNRVLHEFQNETLLTQDNPAVARFVNIYPSNPELAWIYRTVLHPNYRDRLSLTPHQILSAAIGIIDPDNSENVTQFYKDRFEKLLEQLHDKISGSEESRIADAEKATEYWTSANIVRAERDKNWANSVEAQRKEWTSLKHHIQEDMALKAPATYWGNKESRHIRAAGAYGLAFLATITSGLWLYIEKGAPIVADASSGTNSKSLIALAPVVIFAFVMIWLLRIFGRQISNHLQLIEDAGERKAMVMTFLALKYDESHDGALITDQDRILILSALFRPSVVAAIDDAPPAHWFDLLSSRMGSTKKE